MATILITGGTGLIGNALRQALEQKGYHIIILTRNPNANTGSSSPNVRYATWDIEKNYIDKDAISTADYIIHLAGAGVVEKRWTKKRKQEIIDSRVKSSELLVKSMANIPNKIKAIVSATAIGWYGPDPIIPNPTPFTETDPAHDSFLGNTCKLWEQSIEPVTELGKRLVKFRIGIVLSEKGGAMKEFRRPLKFGVTAILGNGKQILSWIHIDDLVKLFIDGIENEKLAGVYNAVAPHPVSNKELTLQLAKARGKFYIPIHVPTFALRLVLGEMSIEVLKSATVSSSKIEKTGFVFKYSTIEEAIT
jgi:uncharacterized protein (TIGR01777 family)